MIDRACISINGICNLNCRYCYFYERDVINTKCVAHFTKDDVITILKNVASYSEKNNINFKIGIVGSGEPLLNFDLIEDILKWLDNDEKAKKHIKLYTISNGYSLKEQSLKKLFEYKHLIDLSISLDGYKELQDYARVRKIGGEFVGTYEKVFETICKYEDIFKQKPSINVTVHKESIKNKEKLLQYLLENDFKNVTFSRLVDCELDDLKITKAEFDQFINWVEDLDIQHKINVRNISVRGKKIDCSMYGAKCGVGQTNIFFADKKVYPCGRFIGKKEYELCSYSSTIEDIEKSFCKLNPAKCEDGCYYDDVVKKVENI
ncbi:radical SAM protein [Intestinibacter sp.]